MKIDKIIDAGHPFYRPLWRRIAIVAVCIGWGLVEFWFDAVIWGTLFTAVGVYCAWTLLWAYDPVAEDREG
jgi:hypothetical protein